MTASSVSNPDTLLSPSEAAEYIGIPEGKLSDHRVCKMGLNYLKIGRLVRYRKSTLDQFIADGDLAPRPETTLTQEQLKEALSYDPDAGVFTRNGSVVDGVDANGYTRIRVKERAYKAHRLAWLYVHGRWPSEIDHINHIRDDNRLINLREVTHAENMRNRSAGKNNKTGVTGVQWSKSARKWISTIKADGKTKRLYYGDSFDDAVTARKTGLIEHNYHENHGK